MTPTKSLNILNAAKLIQRTYARINFGVNYYFDGKSMGSDRWLIENKKLFQISYLIFCYLLWLLVDILMR